MLGEAGIGKTRLVHEVTTDARALGAVVLVGRCSPIDRLTPYRPLAEALLVGLRPVPRPTDAELQPYVPAVARFVPHWRHADDQLGESPAVAAESILRVLAWLAGERPTVLALEDLHWADPATQTLLDYMIDNVADLPVAVMATARSDEPAGPLTATLLRGATVTLGPLSSEEVATLAELRLGWPPTTEQVERLVRVAGGVPLLVEDLLDDAGAGAGAGDARSRFASIVHGRLDSLDATARRAVVAAALVGETADRATLTAALGQSAPVALANAVQAHLLEQTATGVRFRHALTRDAVLAAAGELATSLRGPLARALEANGHDEQLAAAGELHLANDNRGAAARLFAKAAVAAQAVGSPSAAVSLLDRAVQAEPDRTERNGSACECIGSASWSTVAAPPKPPPKPPN